MKSTDTDNESPNGKGQTNGYNMQPDLRERLWVQPPAPLEEASQSLYFERDRNLNLPWQKILESVSTDSGSLTALRAYFERSWGIEGFDKRTMADHVFDISTPKDGDSESKPHQFYIIKFSPEFSVKPVENGLVLKDGFGRFHLCLPAAGMDLSKGDFNTTAAYESFWNEKIRGVELCFEDEASARAGYTHVEYLDLAAKLIMDAYDEAVSERAFDKDLQNELNTAGKELLKKALATEIDLDQIDSLQQSIVALRSQRVFIDRRLDRLRQQAAALGYKLFLESFDHELPDKTTVPVKAGTLYRKENIEYEWTISIERVESGWDRFKRSIGSFFDSNISPEPKRWTEQRTRSAMTDVFEEVDITGDPVTLKINSFQPDKTVYVCERTNAGYITDTGKPLSEIMLRCERDERFRRQCVVFLPVMEKFMNGRSVVAGYNIIHAPFPGIVPVAFPTVSIRESLSYRLAWKEMQLGDVAHTINLAPGETRKITVRRSYEQETTRNETRTTLFDLQESESSDITTELERELKSTDKVEANFGLSKGGGAKGGEAIASSANPDRGLSASFGIEASVERFSRQLSKSIRKASQSMNRKVRTEVTTDTRRSTKISNFDEHTSEVSNVNEGRTLNMVFYRLMNSYETGLYLDDIQFQVTPGTEIIAGSGIHDELVFDASELDRLVDALSADTLPFDMDRANQLKYLRHVVEELEHVLDHEYNTKETGDEKPGSAGLLRMGASRLEVTKKVMPEADSTWSPLKLFSSIADDREATARKKLERAKSKEKAQVKEAEEELARVSEENYLEVKQSLVERLEDLELLGNCVDRQKLQILSPGLYVDSIVGALPSTEEYSERMREQMVELKKAEVARARAEAAYRRSLGERISGNGGNQIVGVLPQRNFNTLSISLRLPLADGSWKLMLDGEAIREIPMDQTGQYMLTLQWESAQSWLQEDDLLNGRIQLYNHEEGRVITQVVTGPKNSTA